MYIYTLYLHITELKNYKIWVNNRNCTEINLNILKIIESGLAQTLCPTNNLQEIEGAEKHIKLYHKDAVNNI